MTTVKCGTPRQAIGTRPGSAGFIAALAQIGDGLGISRTAPMGNLVEKQALTVVVIAVIAVNLFDAVVVSLPLPLLVSFSQRLDQHAPEYGNQLPPQE